MRRNFGNLVDSQIDQGGRPEIRYPDETYLQEKYNLRLDQYIAMYEAQGGACYICERVPKRRLQVDHDHKTGKVRGLLCGSCNYSLGVWKDNPRRFSRAATYLLKSRSPVGRSDTI